MEDPPQAVMGSTVASATGVRLLFAKAATILVGTNESQRTFTVHNAIITKSSTFFAAALAERWTNQTKPLELPEEDPNIFDLYLYCAYSNKVHLIKKPLANLGDEEVDEILLKLAKIYILADKLGDRRAANLIVDSFIETIAETPVLPNPECVVHLWNHSPPGSSLRKLVVDSWAYTARCGAYELPNIGSLPQEFFHEVLREKVGVQAKFGHLQVRKVFDKDFMLDNKCRYHQYDQLHPTDG